MTREELRKKASEIGRNVFYRFTIGGRTLEKEQEAMTYIEAALLEVHNAAYRAGVLFGVQSHANKKALLDACDIDSELSLPESEMRKR